MFINDEVSDTKQPTKGKAVSSRGIFPKIILGAQSDQKRPIMGKSDQNWGPLTI